jgi:hypothetical protein
MKKTNPTTQHTKYTTFLKVHLLNRDDGKPQTSLRVQKRLTVRSLFALFWWSSLKLLLPQQSGNKGESDEGGKAMQ